MCKYCIFSEIKNNDYVFCKNLERCVISTDRCKSFINYNIDKKIKLYKVS